MLLYFLRHAEAEDTAETDFDRRLTDRGRTQVQKVIKFFQRNEIKPDAILFSPLTRAKQTAHPVSDTMGIDMVKMGWLASGMEPETCLRELAPYEDHSSILLVGHEPDFSATIAFLLGLTDPEALHIRKASVTAINMPVLKAGAGQLEFLLPCRLM
jgi:phosphohistidine phosphatase